MNNIKLFDLSEMLTKFGLNPSYAFSETTSWIQKLNAHKINTDLVIDLMNQICSAGISLRSASTLNQVDLKAPVQILVDKILLFEENMMDKSWRSSFEEIEAFEKSCQQYLADIEESIEAVVKDRRIAATAESLVTILIYKLNCLVMECLEEIEKAKLDLAK